MCQKVFLNDGIIDTDQAAIAVDDAGFLYGAGLFETMRASGGVVFCLGDHIDRLFSSAAALSIKNTYEKQYIKDAIHETLDANKLGDARLRLTLTNGPLSSGEENGVATLLITAVDFLAYPADYYENGALVVITPYKQNPCDPMAGHKTTNYYSRLLALDMARKKQAAEALWFTLDNHLAEGCVSNVFLVKDSVVYTPPVDTPVLAGIARKAVLQITQENSIELVEKNLFIDDVLEADEIFMTNIAMEVMPVVQVEKHTVGDGKVGEMAKRIGRLFTDFVGDNCKGKK